MKIIAHLNDYEIIDTANGDKLENWNGYTLRRPDAHAIGSVSDGRLWSRPDASFKVVQGGPGTWQINTATPEPWFISYKRMKLKLALSPYKHTGVFPEQAPNWDWMGELIRQSKEPVRILNLFAYTGAASLVASKAGAQEVVHVEASKSILQWAKENRDLNDMQDAHIRYISEDALTFVQRELKRGHTYHGILMDPPAFGRGPKGEIWRFEDDIETLVTACALLLDPKPLFFLVNAYTDGFKENLMAELLKKTFRNVPKEIEVAALALPIKSKPEPLACGVTGRIVFK